MKAFKAFALMFVVIFIWIFTLPLLFLTSIIWLPLGALLIISLTTISFLVQLHHAENITVNGVTRKLVANVPLESWFKGYEVADSNPTGFIIAHPHGILCCGMVVYHFRKRTDTVFAVAPILFYIPVFGWLARDLGLIPASDFMIRKALKEGHTVIMYVGGVEELIAHEKRELYIEKRWGYLKIIRDLKCKVTCAWTKGEFDTFFLPPMPMLRLRQRVAKILGFGIIFPWVFGWNSIWVPRRIPLKVSFFTLQQTNSLRLEDLKQWYHQGLRHIIGLSERSERTRLENFLRLE